MTHPLATMSPHHNEPTKEVTMNTLHNELKKNTERLLDSVDNGGIDLADAVIQALLADGFEFEDAAKAFNTISLAYGIRRHENETAR